MAAKETVLSPVAGGVLRKSAEALTPFFDTIAIAAESTFRGRVRGSQGWGGGWVEGGEGVVCMGVGAVSQALSLVWDSWDGKGVYGG